MFSNVLPSIVFDLSGLGINKPTTLYSSNRTGATHSPGEGATANLVWRVRRTKLRYSIAFLVERGQMEGCDSGPAKLPDWGGGAMLKCGMGNGEIVNGELRMVNGE